MRQSAFFQKLIPAAKNTVIRFPLSFLCALGISIAAIYLIEEGFESQPYQILNLMLSFLIGLPLSIFLQLLTESPSFKKSNRFWIYPFFIIVLILISLALPNKLTEIRSAVPFIRFALFFASAHLLLALIPMLYKKGLNGFWNYNKELFIQLLIAQVFSTALTWGLQLAVLALKLLFDVDISERIFFEIGVIVYAIFHTWFFLSRYPTNFDELENDTEYPKGLKIFSQYIFLPLLTLYLLILYAYGAKIVMNWSWPKGLVSYLIVCISMIGGLTFLLLYPYARQSENQWIRNSTRWYYVLLMPLLILLFIAIFMRIGDYGFTMSRYALLIFGIWAFIISIFTLTEKTNIRFIPASLTFVLIALSFGPWGIDSFCANQQKNRLEKILIQTGYLKDGKLNREEKYSDSLFNEVSYNRISVLTDSLHREVISIVQYLDEFHTCKVLNEWYRQPIDSIYQTKVNQKDKDDVYPSEKEIYLKLMGIDPYQVKSDNETNNSFQLYDEETPTSTLVSGYDLLIEFEQENSDNSIPDQTISLYDETILFNQKKFDTKVVQLPGATTEWIIQVNGISDTLNISSWMLGNCLKAEKENGKAFKTSELVVSKNFNNKWGYQVYFSKMEVVKNKEKSYALLGCKASVLLNMPD